MTKWHGKPIIRIDISFERAKELYNKVCPRVNMRGENWRIKYIETDEELNDSLGNGRTTFCIRLSDLTDDEKNKLEGANFFDDPSLLCLVGCQKETYPGEYWMGEC